MIKVIILERSYKMAKSLITGTVTSSSVAPVEVAEGTAIWIGIAAILALIGGILLYFLFVNQKKDPKNKFAKWLKDFLSFKIFWVEGVMKIFYYIATIFTILFSFSFLAAGGLGVLAWLITLVLGPVFVRLGYELILMFIMIWRNTRDIAENTKKK